MVSKDKCSKIVSGYSIKNSISILKIDYENKRLNQYMLKKEEDIFKF